MIKGEIFFAEAPLDFIHFFAVASKLAVHHKRKTPIRVSFRLVAMKRTYGA